MEKGDLIFVYGTLRRGERMDLRKQSLNFGVSFISNDKINGQMYLVGTYPGVKAVQTRFQANQPTVVGEVFRIIAPAIVAVLDAYEGYQSDNPTSGLYDRIQTQSQRGRTVWAYIYNPPVRDEQLIESGDWCRNRHTVAEGRRMML
jgi:gamma-glutamylcyclotransferase (GGCT)/AIG2-like uncharacterized protein YtfP